MDDQPGQAERVRSELTCPQCDYSLRGLHGDVVNCPECGHECNIKAELRRYEDWTASAYLCAMGPVYTILLGLAIALLAALVDDWGVWIMCYAIEPAVLIFWITVVCSVAGHFGLRTGVPLMLRSHLILMTALASFAVLVLLIVGVVTTGSVVVLVLSPLFMFLSLVGAYMVVRMNRALRAHCELIDLERGLANHDAAGK